MKGDSSLWEHSHTYKFNILAGLNEFYMYFSTLYVTQLLTKYKVVFSHTSYCEAGAWSTSICVYTHTQENEYITILFQDS